MNWFVLKAPNFTVPLAGKYSKGCGTFKDFLVAISGVRVQSLLLHSLLAQIGLKGEAENSPRCLSLPGNGPKEVALIFFPSYSSGLEPGSDLRTPNCFQRAGAGCLVSSLSPLLPGRVLLYFSALTGFCTA